MTDLSRRDSAKVEEVLAALRRACGDRLLAVALSGEAATAGYRPGKSRLSFAVVVDTVDAAILDAIRPIVGRWWHRNVATPLLLDPLYLETSRDVFPLEFLDLLDRHRLLVGRIDPFADARIERVHLRIELEEQLRGKMLHLWEAYLETRGVRRLRSVMLDTLPYFHILLRGALFLIDEDRPTVPRDLICAVEEAYRIDLPTFGVLEATRVGASLVTRSTVASVFMRYLDEVRTLVRVVNAA